MRVDIEQHIRVCPASQSLHVADCRAALEHVCCPGVTRTVQMHISGQPQTFAYVLEIPGEVHWVDRASVFVGKYEVVRIFPVGIFSLLFLLPRFYFLEQEADIFGDGDGAQGFFRFRVLLFQLWLAVFHYEGLVNDDVVFPSMDMFP